MKIVIRWFAILTLSISSSLSLAWNNFGHMVVAAIAYDHLTPESRTRVSTLLKLNPHYSLWIEGVAADQQDEIAFMEAATWPDYIKHAQGYIDEGENPTNPNAAKNIGYSDKLMHKYWHYIDIPFSPDNTPLLQPKTPNAQTQITAFRHVLADSNTSDKLKSYDLVWLLHLIGDVHQPLHATSRFTADAPQGDEGGNLVVLTAAPKELHAELDDILGTSNDPAKAIAFASNIAAPDKDKAAINDQSKWINESFNAAKKSVYVDPVGNGLGPYTLSASYKASVTRIAKSRIALAGARLANVINDELK